MGKLGIKCGNCKGYHPTVMAVKACHGAIPAQTSEAPAPEPKGFAGSEKQEKYIRDLIASRAPSMENVDTVLAALDNRIKVSKMIDWLKAQPKVSVAKTGTSKFPPLPQVPEGHYAIKSLTGNNDLDFFRVDRPTEGAHAGKTFVKRVIGGKPDVNVRFNQYREILQAIVDAGIEEAATLYGQTIGRCWKCNRHLTDETSRALGIGPDCRSRAA